jgi:hypothetical protein
MARSRYPNGESPPSKVGEDVLAFTTSLKLLTNSVYHYKVCYRQPKIRLTVRGCLKIKPIAQKCLSQNSVISQLLCAAIIMLSE